MENAQASTASAASAMPTAMAQSTNGQTRQFLTFQVGKAEYGVDIMSVREIKGWVEATRLPNTPAYMRGVINLRGAIIPIFDLRCRFDQGVTEANAKHVVAILAVEERNIGLLVDAVSDIVTVDLGSIKNAPQDNGVKTDEPFVDGLISYEERMIVLLNIAQLFRADDVVLQGQIPPDLPVAAEMHA